MRLAVRVRKVRTTSLVTRPLVCRGTVPRTIWAPVAFQRERLNDCAVVMGIANCERATLPPLATPCVPSDQKLYRDSWDDGMALAEPRFLLFSSVLILEMMSSSRAATPSETLQNEWLAAKVGSSHGRLKLPSLAPGLQQRLSFASGSRHCAVGCGLGGPGGAGGVGGGHGPCVAAPQQRSLWWQHSAHFGLPQEPGPQVLAAQVAAHTKRQSATTSGLARRMPRGK